MLRSFLSGPLKLPSATKKSNREIFLNIELRYVLNGDDDDNNTNNIKSYILKCKYWASLGKRPNFD